MAPKAVPPDYDAAWLRDLPRAASLSTPAAVDDLGRRLLVRAGSMSESSP
jgi:hypothetical protein